jgi:hypothetical protein
MTFDANAIFEDELSRRGIAFVRKNDDEYSIEVDRFKVTANLFNVRRNAERDNDPETIRRFVDRVLTTFPLKLLSWVEASERLLFSAEAADQDFDDEVRLPVTDEVVRVLTLTDCDQSSVAWVTSKMCEDWGVPVEQAISAALANQARLLEGIELEVAEADGKALGMIPLEGPYKASVIFSPAFKRLVEPRFGWPVLVVIPCRDFIYVLADESPLLGQIGSVVVSEFRNSGYPITTEVLRISDEGIEAIGHFPA